MTTPTDPPSTSHAPDGDRPTHVEGHALGSHRLGEHVVGQRVVVRRLLPGQTGPTGGPAFTDTLGECLSWGRGLCEVRTEDGTVVAIHLADIVSGKPVPPRDSVRMRTPARTLHLRSLGLLDGVVTSALGEWVFRDGGLALDGRATKRGHSVLAIGHPGVPVAEAADLVVAHHRALGTPPLAQVVVGSPEEEALLGLGWNPVGTRFEALLAPLSRVQRLLPPAPPVADLAESTEGHLATANVGDGARVRVAIDDTHGDVWGCVGDLWVTERQRRTGLARAVLAEAVDWAASRGVTTLHLQVESDNPAAVALYRSIGFSTHHEYRFLSAPC
ncbi:GNAT family N-acetyltransferase [Nocardioides yefusunii]|uniref:GNAT family N-acetyltransferase n=1 Tax=Nocardioides yefusunii TaxID=2500546 RepID=A0ABW1QVP6_9ACTN|nr:GNAT family N-acetyltransferase [Nocardioides yefusunii]